jgi:NAD-dependent SIR2 family protein deacetylase
LFCALFIFIHFHYLFIYFFRGPNGVWTLQAQGRSYSGTVTDSIQAIPSPAHMSLVKLQQVGTLKYLISQNCDGLHRESGINASQLSELHGNTNLETCSQCKKEYLRDYDASADYRHSVHDHRTGRKCDDCGGLFSFFLILGYFIF